VRKVERECDCGCNTSVIAGVIQVSYRKCECEKKRKHEREKESECERVQLSVVCNALTYTHLQFPVGLRVLVLKLSTAICTSIHKITCQIQLQAMGQTNVLWADLNETHQERWGAGVEYHFQEI